MDHRSILLAAALLSPSLVLGQSFNVAVPVVTNSDSRLIGRMLDPTYVDYSSLARREERRIKWEFDLGAGYTRTEGDARVSSGDVELDATLASGTILKFLSGYGRTRFAGQSASGLSDFTLQAIQPLAPVGEGALLGAVGVTVPSGTDVSANHASQSAALYFINPLAPRWRMLAVAQGSHTNVPLPEGISREAYAGVLRIVHGFDDKFRSDVWLQYVGSHRSGTTTFQQVSAAYEAALNEGIGMRFVANRGLSKGSKNTGGQLTLIWSF